MKYKHIVRWLKISPEKNHLGGLLSGVGIFSGLLSGGLLSVIQRRLSHNISSTRQAAANFAIK